MSAGFVGFRRSLDGGDFAQERQRTVVAFIHRHERQAAWVGASKTDLSGEHEADLQVVHVN